jgi:hypothetical protein
MYTVSFAKEALNITICNQYPGLELKSPIYCSNGTVCYVSPSQQTDISATMEARFGIDSEQDNIKGALLYKLQRKHVDGTDNQSNNSTASIENTTNMHFLVLWNVEDYFHAFRVCLIECAADFTWDEDKLWALHDEYHLQLYADYKSGIIAWLMHEGSVMKTKLDVIYESDYELNIIISEGTEKCNMEEPVKIEPERLVLL